ncbi:MAG: putative lipid II flippase FtsW [Gammaproteobacteria bacterium]|nr:putative lipid II flippase FtsW [Gammaproteobacteria bacterium]
MQRILTAKPYFQARAIGGESYRVDYWLLASVIALLTIGLVMMGSASISIAEKMHGEPFYYIWRQIFYIAVALVLSFGVLHVPTGYWNKLGPSLLLFGMVLLVLVLLVGKPVNGSMRWIDFGVFKVQPSELMKLFAVVFIAGYLVRRGDEVRTTIKGFLKPMLILGVAGVLLLLEPDFGSGVVIAFTALGMMFLAGVRLWQFGVLIMVMAMALSLLAYTSPYRVERLTSFLNPWADPFDSGFQLTQALIAFGRGEWFGVGLGGSIQKLFYLPEAHTDFLFAVISEELGLSGGLLVVVLFVILVYRAFRIGHIALCHEDRFAGYLAFGSGLLIGFQALINIGVNMGMLPTKGLTLPLMSYGGSSVVTTCIACAMLLRIAHQYPVAAETRLPHGKEKRIAYKRR